MSRPKIAIAHDYLTQRGGAERVVLSMARAFPEATIHTLLYDEEATLSEFADHRIVTSPLNDVPAVRRNHRLGLPLLAAAASAMKIDADVVIASSSGWAHGMRTTGQKVVYCYSPARWLYQSDQYLGADPPAAQRLGLAALRPALKAWDRRVARTADRYLAISTAVQHRIRDTYGLDATVVPAPVTLDRAEATELADRELARLLAGGPFYLVISRLLPYKNIDVAVRAFDDLGDRRLVVVGKGPELTRLKEIAGPNVVFLSDLDDGEMHWLYAHCQAVLAVSYEDYGLTPLEAALHGRPSVVLRWGGFLDTMIEGETAVFVDRPTPEDLRAGVHELESRSWDARAIKANVVRFSEAAFVRRLREILSPSGATQVDAQVDARSGV